jgi:Na+-transporting methylmalonyl-CoA/oxaloacetate decarboxylase gamma subunit
MRHPALFIILVIIGIGMVSSLFNKEPSPEEQKKTAEYIQQKEKEREKMKYEECKKKFPMVKLDAKDIERLAECMK